MVGQRKYEFSETFYMLIVHSKSVCVENKMLCEVNANNLYAIITSQSRINFLNFYYRKRFQKVFINCSATQRNLFGVVLNLLLEYYSYSVVLKI